MPRPTKRRERPDRNAIVIDECRGQCRAGSVSAELREPGACRRLPLRVVVGVRASCTAWAACGDRHRLPARDVEQARVRPGFGLAAPPKNAVAARTGSSTSSGVPQPSLGRCWKRPSESRSPSVQVPQARLLRRGGEGDDDALVGHAERPADLDDDAGVRAHLVGERHAHRRHRQHDGTGRRNDEHLAGVDQGRSRRARSNAIELGDASCRGRRRSRSACRPSTTTWRRPWPGPAPAASPVAECRRRSLGGDRAGIGGRRRSAARSSRPGR